MPPRCDRLPHLGKHGSNPTNHPCDCFRFTAVIVPVWSAVMVESRRSGASCTRPMLCKVPEVTVWFWAIKVLCTTVGESFADWINTSLGAGLTATAVIFTAVLAG